MSHPNPQFDLILSAVPAILRTSPEAVADLVARGEILAEVYDGIEYVSTNHLRNAGLFDLLTVDQFAASRAITPEQCVSLIRLGVLTATQPFAPLDSTLRIARSEAGRVTPDAIAATAAELEEWHAQEAVRIAAAEQQAKELAERSAVEILARTLDVPADLIAEAILEVLADATETAPVKTKAGRR